MKAAPMKRLQAPRPIYATRALIATAAAVACLALGVVGRETIWRRPPIPSKPASSTAVKSPARDAQALAAPSEAVAVAPPARMTPAQQADFEAWLVKTYLRCWKPAPQSPDADPYVAQVRIAYKPDGSLSRPPKLVNPPSNPTQRPQANSVMLAIQSCNPLPVPAQYRPFYEQWKTKTIHFDPQIAAR